LKVEQGDVALDDASVRDLVALYELPKRPWIVAPNLEVLLDRSTVSKATGVSLARHVDPLAVMARLIAVFALLGIDMLTGLPDLTHVGAGLDLDVSEVEWAIERTVDDSRDLIGQSIDTMIDRVLVPGAGILIAEVPVGSLVVVHSGLNRDPLFVDAATTFSEVLVAV
jgi:hypothetical protein